MPPAIIVPEKFYGLMNITELQELTVIINNVSKSYDEFKRKYSFAGKDLFPDSNPFMEFIMKRVSKSKEYERMKAFAEIFLEELDRKNHFLFVVCTDKSGNKNTQDFYFKFGVNDSFQDVQPPMILLTIPENNSLSDTLTGYVDLKVYTNEVAECKYDEVDMDYKNMEFELECPISSYAMSPVLGGTYECETEILVEENSTFYIRCIDNPQRIDSYALILKQSTVFNVSQTRYLNLTSPNIITAAANQLIRTIEVNTPSVSLNMFIDEPYSCRYASNDTSYDEMYNNFICNQASTEMLDIGMYKCSTDITVAERTYIKCKETIQKDRNVMDESYELSLIHS